MAAVVKKQDMPPPGGYKPINYKRIPAKTFFNGWSMIGMYLGTTAAASYLYFLNCKQIQHEEIEQRSAELALYPMLLAEKDRMYLKQLRKNRDEEANLMANVEGWKVGTWYGEPVYHNYKNNELVDIRMKDYYVHASMKDYLNVVDITMWT